MISIVAALFRAKRAILITFFTTFALVLAAWLLLPHKYVAHTSFLVKNERADTLISADPHQNAIQHGDITEEDINSEVQILGSDGILQQVVHICGLDQEFLKDKKSPQEAVERGVRKLKKDLAIVPVRKSSLIDVTYTSPNRALSLSVLSTLSNLYLQRHIDLHTSGGASSFFVAKSEELRKRLQSAEAERADYLQSHNYSLLPEQKHLLVQQMMDTQRARNEVDASVIESQSRLQQIERQSKTATERITTQQKVSANQYSIERLNTMLADLENQRSELASKFRPGDRLLVEKEAQIASTNKALTEAQKMSSTDVTTDLNPIRQSLDAETVRLHQIISGLASRSVDLRTQQNDLKTSITTMEADTAHVEDMNREIRQLEDNYALFQSKASASSIADSLDTAKISNVVVADSPIVPALPKTSLINPLTGLLLALFLSAAIGILIDLKSNKIYTPEFLESETGLTVLAVLPRKELA